MIKLCFVVELLVLSLAIIFYHTRQIRQRDGSEKECTLWEVYLLFVISYSRYTENRHTELPEEFPTYTKKCIALV
jgi:hypothetical protein